MARGRKKKKIEPVVDGVEKALKTAIRELFPTTNEDPEVTVTTTTNGGNEVVNIETPIKPSWVFKPNMDKITGKDVARILALRGLVISKSEFLKIDKIGLSEHFVEVELGTKLCLEY